jgi:hypothetical protein
MAHPRRKYLLLAAATILVSALGYLAYILFVQEQYVVTTLDAGQDREVVIWADRYVENCQPFYYEVKVSGRITSPMSFISCSWEEPPFKLLSSKDRNLVGVVDGERPEVLLVLHDFASGETWPRGKDSDDWRVNSDRGRRLRDRLRADHPQLSLALSGEVP